jgi:hypothetical protein
MAEARSGMSARQVPASVHACGPTWAGATIPRRGIGRVGSVNDPLRQNDAISLAREAASAAGAVERLVRTSHWRQSADGKLQPRAKRTLVTTATY